MSSNDLGLEFIAKLPPAFRQLVREGITPASQAAVEMEMQSGAWKTMDPLALPRLLTNLTALEQILARNQEGQAIVAALLERHTRSEFTVATLETFLAEADKLDDLESRIGRQRANLRRTGRQSLFLLILILFGLAQAWFRENRVAAGLLLITGVAACAKYLGDRSALLTATERASKLSRLHAKAKATIIDGMQRLCFYDAGIFGR